MYLSSWQLQLTACAQLRTFSADSTFCSSSRLQSPCIQRGDRRPSLLKTVVPSLQNRVHGKLISHVSTHLYLRALACISLRYFITYKHMYLTDCVHSVFKNRYVSIIYPVDGSLVESIPSPSFSLFFILYIYLAHCMVPGCVEYTHADLLSSYLQNFSYAG